jgi:hypothetical protein
VAEWLADPRTDAVAHYGERGEKALCGHPSRPVIIPATAIPSHPSARQRCMGCVEKRVEQKLQGVQG